MIIGKFRGFFFWDSCDNSHFSRNLCIWSKFPNIVTKDVTVTVSFYCLHCLYGVCYSSLGLVICAYFSSPWSVSTKCGQFTWSFQILALLILNFILLVFPVLLISAFIIYLSFSSDLICLNFSLILSLMHLRL